MNRYVKYVILILVELILILLLLEFPAPNDRMLNIQNCLITAGGIMSAFIATFLFAKLFNLKANRENRQLQIDRLSKRLTAFRKLMYFIMDSKDFWVRYSDIIKFKENYSDYDYHRFYEDGEEERSQEIWEKENISQNTILLYTAMKAIYGTPKKSLIPWAYQDEIAVCRYTMDDLDDYYFPSNALWYYLDGRYAKHGEGLFRDVGLSTSYQKNYTRLLSIAAPKLVGKDFHRLVIAELGSEFHNCVIPEMKELIGQNKGIPKGFLKTFYSLILIMLFGVIFPIILQSLSVSKCLNSILTLLFVNFTILSLCFFLIDFYVLLRDELDTNKNDS